MSLFSLFKGKTASGSSSTLQKIRTDSERRRAAKSSGMLPMVEGEVVERTISSLEQRISTNSYSGSVKPPTKPAK
jgi:hypothetical protein